MKLNFSVSIFGVLGDGFTLYPDDYAKGIYQQFYARSTAPTQIIIHRDDNLMYYGYVRELGEAGQYIGICILLNNVLLTQIDALFSIFEKIISAFTMRGKLLRFTDDGTLTSDVISLADYREEVSEVIAGISLDVENLSNSAQDLPPVNYSIPNGETKSFTINSTSIEEVVQASANYGFTYVYKDHDYDTQDMTSCAGVIRNLKEENTEQKEKITQLEKECKKYKQKEIGNYVGCFMILLFICVIGVIALRDRRDGLKESLEVEKTKNTELSNEIDRLNYSNTKLSNKIDRLNDSNTELSNEIANLNGDIDRLTKNLSSYTQVMPIRITKVEMANKYYNGDIETDYGKTIYSSRSMYLAPRITYTAYHSGDITLYIRLYKPDGTISEGKGSPKGYSFSRSFNYYEGDFMVSLLGWGGESMGHWKSGQYRIEFWYGKICLASHNFKIY